MEGKAPYTCNVPQVAFLFGAQVLLLSAGLQGTWGALIWAHLLFVLPYLFLSLSEPFRKLDPRFARTALCLGAGPNRVFWRIKAPMLLRPIAIALAVGFAVSVGGPAGAMDEAPQHQRIAM